MNTVSLLRHARISRKGTRGLSLVEVLFAATLIGLIMVFLFTLYPSSIMATKHAEHRTKATLIAQSILEEKRYAPFSDLYVPPAGMAAVTGEDGHAYHPVNYECFDVPDSSAGLLKGIHVTVTWKEKVKDYSITQELYVWNMPR